MNQIMIGKFIAFKRKQKNLTQEQLAQILNISNKTVSKWETGKSMPDYTLVKPLCEALNISVSELIDGQTLNESVKINEDQLIELMRKTQQLENQRVLLYGVIFVTMGTSMQALAYSTDKSYLFGCMLFVSIVELILGLGTIIRYLLK
ncbi:helix-turn-helix domain-containing protein [uncultured Catenibacterium sp.]|uniref:helix-turn-helix domain-containing protein n=1 Tax=uncultured Catenibacterium sp. TaxID=286142 RepID=UPI0026382D06|nr:helix-turn-helix transcriptional regulator [uncultured Catenibacterium sp.]